MANSTTNLDLLSGAQAQKEVTANALFDAASPSMLFGRRGVATTGMTWGYYGGNISDGSVITGIVNGTVTLTPSTTNYVEATAAGVVSANTSGFTAGRTPLYTIVAGASTVTSYTDHRMAAGGGSGVSAKRIATPSWSSAMTLSWSSYDVYRITLGGDTTLSFAGGTDGQNCQLELLQDGTGNRLVSWPATARFPSEILAPALTTTAGKMDRVGFQVNTGLGKYDCVAVVKGY